MPATTEMRISDLNTASILDESDLLEISKVNGTSASGYMSYKTTLFAIALYVTKLANYTSDLQTTNKTVIGAINELKQLISLIPRFSIEVVETLPTEDISVSTLYLVPSSDPETGNYYEEYIYVDDAWEMVGTTAVDLSDYYTKTQVDTLLNNKVDKVSGKGLSTNDFINNARYPDLTAGKSLSLVTKTYGVEANDSAPYVYRQFPASVINSKLEKLKKIVGASVVWNQILRNGNFADTTNWRTNGSATTFSASNNTAVVSTSSNNGGIYSNNIPLVANHKYIYSFEVKNTVAMSCGFSQFSSGRQAIPVNSTSTRYTFIGTPSSNGNGQFAFYSSSADSNSIEIKNVYLTDLTAMFGSTIADYVSTLETAQAGSGIAWLQKYGFFTEEYYGYSANTIQSVSVSAHVTKDSNDQPLTTTALDHTTLRGLFKLDANNNLYADGDIYNADGSGSVKYGFVEFDGSEDENWEINNSGTESFYYSIANQIPETLGATSNSICNEFIFKTIGNTGSDVGFFITSGKVIRVRDSAEKTIANWKTWLSSHPITIQYPLATPTTATLTPFNPLSDIETGGTEEFVDYGVEQGNRDVAIPAGTDTDFYEEVETVMPLPNVPFEDGTYMLTAEVEDNEPVFKFARITT